MGRRTLLLTAFVLLAFLAGWLVGRASNEPGPQPTGEACVADSSAIQRRSDAATPPAEASAASPSTSEEERGFDLLSALGDVITSLWSQQPLTVVDALTDTMSDSELESVLTSLTDLTEEDLAEVGDLRAFSRRLSRIAAEGVLTDLESAEPEGLETLELYSPDSDSPSDVFDTTHYKIIGEYAVRADGPSRVLIKWIREEPYELLQLRRQNIHPSSDLLVINGIQPDGWREGVYRLQVFAVNDAMDLLAQARFRVVGGSDALEASTSHGVDESVGQ